MSALIFDTHAFVKKLVEAGMPERQAEILATEQAKLIDERLATKRDLQELEYRLTIKLSAMLSVAIGITVTLLKLL